ncbi:sperm acrosome-associated protein 9 [Acridotheres tristis]
MDEVVETLRKIEQNYKLFQQQQLTFIRALKLSRVEANDVVRPVSSISQVQCYKDHHCYNSRDRHVLNMFISICNDLRNLCQKLEKVHPGDRVSNDLLEKCKVLLNDSNDFTALRATYPHGVVNYLSLAEAIDCYAGVVSLIPIVLDTVREWITYTNKHLLPNVSHGHVTSEKETPTFQTPPDRHLASQTSISNKNTVQLQDRKCSNRECKCEDPCLKNKAPWMPPGKHRYSATVATATAARLPRQRRSREPSVSAVRPVTAQPRSTWGAATPPPPAHRPIQKQVNMDEVVETLRKIEQNYKLFQQQQFTFIRALEHTREEAHDLFKPVSSILQVQCYKDHHCYNSTDRRILNMFISICNDLRNLCQKLEKVHPGDSVTKGLVEKCKVLLNDSNDLTALRATYPHGVVNYLSLEEAKHRYGGVVSLIPIVLDTVREWITYTNKHLLPNVSHGHVTSEKETPTSQTPPVRHLASQTSISNKNTVQLQDRKCPKCKYEDPRLKNKAPWRPPGKHCY